MIRAILVDLDGVIRIWSPEKDRQAEQAAGLPGGAIWKAAFSKDLLLPAITGRVSDEDWRRQVVDQLRLDFPQADADEAVRLWSSSSGEVDWDVVEVVRVCRKRAPVVLITNATSRLPFDLERLGLADEFDRVINSSEVGWIKPQAEIFRAALQAVGVSAKVAFFVDDNAEHVAAACQIGMTGHVYGGVDQLRRELERLGLL
jgi:putative hydrolase of the HAD superfamily